MSFSLVELRTRFLEAQLRGDRRRASAIVLDEGLSAGAAVDDLHEHVLQGAQREIGRLWEENRISVAQEHMATAIAGLVLTQLFERAPSAPRNGKRVLVACVEGEKHDFPARLVADALDLAGFGVSFLGADVPIESLVRMIDEDRPDLVALSATMSLHAPALRNEVKAIRDRFGKSLLLAAGGGALVWAPTLGRELDLDIVANDAKSLVVEARRQLEIP
ncbi:MAG TPA: cobalamin-dependent protein [Polyangiaceae bacterium]